MSDYLDLGTRMHRHGEIAAMEEANALQRRKLELDEAAAANALAAAKSANRATWAAALAAIASAVGILLQLLLR